MRSENHPRRSAAIVDRHRVRRREDGIVEIIERRSPSVDDRVLDADALCLPPRWRPSLPPLARAPSWYSIASAMRSMPARIFDAFADGFALYAVLMNPGLFWFSSWNFDRDDPPDDAAGGRDPRSLR